MNVLHRAFRRLAALLAVLALLAGAALAADEATLTVSSAAAGPGESVTLTLSLTDNPGYAAFSFSVDFDESRLEMTDFRLTSGGALSMASASTHAATYAALREKTGDGALATLTFRVRDDAPAGAVSVTLKDVGFFRADESRIAVATAAGSVAVGGELPTEPSGPDAPAQPEMPAPSAAQEPPVGEEPKAPAVPAEKTPVETDAPTPEALPPVGPDEPGSPVMETTVEIDPAAQAREELDLSRTVVYEVEREAGSASSAVGVETVTVPFPEGKTGDARSYRAYLVTEDGDLEALSVTETAAGLSVVTDSERPIAVTWEEKAAAIAPTSAETAQPLPEPTPDEEAPTAPPAPEAALERNVGGAVAAAGIGAAVLVAVLLLIRRKRG